MVDDRHKTGKPIGRGGLAKWVTFGFINGALAGFVVMYSLGAQERPTRAMVIGGILGSLVAGIMLWLRPYFQSNGRPEEKK